MTLNWNIEVIFDFILALAGFICTIISYLAPKTRKITSLNFFRFSIFGMFIFMALDGLSFLFVSDFIARLTGLALIPTTLSAIIGVNYTLRETYYSKGFVLVFGLSILFLFVGFQPNATIPSTESGYLRMDWVGVFNILGILFTAICVLYLFYWGIKTWLNAPLLIKKEASLFFMGISITSILGLFFYLLYLFESFFILLSNLSILIGIIIFLIAILKEPKLLYILPFTVHRILVKDREGAPLYDHDWVESNITETIFTGFLNAVQLMSQEVMDIGGIFDINLEEGILIMRESKLVTVGLVASKSSKLLRESVIKFTRDFEEKFERELKKSVKDMSQYTGAYDLIEKHFSNFPYKIIKSKKQPLILTGKYIKIPLELETKLRSVFTDEEEYETIKTELIKSPLSMPTEFINLYNDLKHEIDQLSGEDLKYLNTNLSNEE